MKIDRLIAEANYGNIQPMRPTQTYGGIYKLHEISPNMCGLIAHLLKVAPLYRDLVEHMDRVSPCCEKFHDEWCGKCVSCKDHEALINRIEELETETAPVGAES